MSPTNKPAKKTRSRRKTKAEEARAPVAVVSAKDDLPKRAHRLEGRYIYGVIDAGTPDALGKSNLGGASEDVYTVGYSGIAAVVSRTPVFIFDPTRDNALAHERVIESVMKNHTIIPMSFGTVFRTDQDVREVLPTIYPTLKSVLRQRQGKQ